MSDHKWGILYQDVLLTQKTPGFPDNEFELARVINKKEENDANYEEVQKAMTFGFQLRDHAVDPKTSKLIM